jgi:hypothetical protein
MAPDPKIHLALACLLQDFRSDPKLAANVQVLDEWNHRRVLTAVLDGKIPAERINVRWYYRQADRQRIAEILGVTPKPRIGRPARRQAASPSNAAVAA